MNEANTAVITAPIEKGTLSLAEVLRHVELVEEVLHKVMKENTHYGQSFPGDTKKNLLKPGADKLCLAFGLSPSFVVMERELEHGHREYRFTCLLTTATGRIMGEGVGLCSTMEPKYRYRNAARKCPECGKEAIIKGKEEYGGGWVCFKKKDGCGFKWPDGAAVIEKQEGGKVENADIAEVYNTCLKIAKKRAYVDATITATAASDLFTQDIEDLRDTAMAEEKKEAAREEQMNGERLRQRQQQAGEHQEERREAPKAGPVPASTAGPKSTPPVNTPAASGTTDDINQRIATAYAAVQRFLGAKAASRVWAAYKATDKRDERLRVLEQLAGDCQHIISVMGSEPGGQMIGDEVDAAGNDQMDAAKVAGLVASLHKCAQGEVAP
jgi:hypothetical protein